LLRFIYRVTGQLELAQEGVNDVMMVVWRNAEEFARRSSVSTWIMGIAYRKALKLLERSRRWSDRFASVDFDEWIERSDAPAEPSDDGDLRDLLDQALKHLSAEHRAVVELTYFYGCSYEEIAVIAGCPVNTVKTRMFHARAKLRKLLPTLGQDLPST
jgi:RNA polymerase sigma-70 factor (ECF subfamily)